MKTCFIEQTCGLGDILLSIKIGQHFANLGHRVIWPIEHTYHYLNDYVEAEGINFFDITQDFDFKHTFLFFQQNQINEVYEDDNFIHVPLKRSFHSEAGKKIHTYDSHDAANMHGKFAMCSLTSENWQDCFKFKRNHEQETKLFTQLQIDGACHIVNKKFGTPPWWDETLNKTIITPPGYKTIEMYMDPAFTVFDWLLTLEKADRIDTVSTSTFYLFEKIDLNCVPTIYSRNTPERSHKENFGWLQTLAKKNYLFIS